MVWRLNKIFKFKIMFYILISLLFSFSIILLLSGERHIVGGQKISLERIDLYFLDTVNHLNYRRAKLFHIYGIWEPCSFYSESLLPLVEASETTEEVSLDVTVKKKIPAVEVTALLNYIGNTGSLRATVLEKHVTLVETKPCVRKNFVQAYRFTHPDS